MNETSEPIRTAAEVAAKIGSASTSGIQKNPPGKNYQRVFFCSFNFTVIERSADITLSSLIGGGSLTILLYHM